MRNTETKKTLKTYMAIALALAVVMAGSTALIRMNATAGAETATITETSTVVASPFTEAVEKVHGSVVGVSNYTNYTGRNSYGGMYGLALGMAMATAMTAAATMRTTAVRCCRAPAAALWWPKATC